MLARLKTEGATPWQSLRAQKTAVGGHRIDAGPNYSEDSTLTKT